MNEPSEEDQLGRALHLLGHAQPPAGMEDRLNQRLRHRQAELAQRTSSRKQNGMRSVLGFALACSVIAVVVMVVRHADQPLNAPAPTHASTVPLMHASPVPAIEAKAGTANVAAGNARRTPLRLVVSSKRPARSAAPGMVATPLPLTEQEKLLLALARAPRYAATSGLEHVELAQTTGDRELLRRNALFELDHERITPLPPPELESTPIPPLASNPISLGDHQ